MVEVKGIEWPKTRLLLGDCGQAPSRAWEEGDLGIHSVFTTSANDLTTLVSVSSSIQSGSYRNDGLWGISGTGHMADLS